MAKTPPHITAAELEIMKVLWSLGAATVRQTLDSLPHGSHGRLAYTTVMTLMKQLADKGALQVDRSREPYVYKAAVRREAVLGHRVLQLLQSVFDGQAEELVLHLVEEADLSAEDLHRIEAKIRKREQADQGKHKGRTRREEDKT